MLKFSEELALLALDDKSGALRPMPERLFALVLAGAVLCELAFAKRIGASSDSVFLLSEESMGDSVCDDALGVLRNMGKAVPTAEALSEISAHVDFYISNIFSSLVSRGVLEKRGEKFLWIFRREKYSLASDSDLTAVKVRIERIIKNPESVPSGHDVIIISLMDCAGLSDSIFTRDELKTCSKRIRDVSKMDLIARSLSDTIARLHRAILDVIARI